MTTEGFWAPINTRPKDRKGQQWSYSLTLGPPFMEPFLPGFPDCRHLDVSVLTGRDGIGNGGAGGIGHKRVCAAMRLIRLLLLPASTGSFWGLSSVMSASFALQHRVSKCSHVGATFERKTKDGAKLI